MLWKIKALSGTQEMDCPVWAQYIFVSIAGLDGSNQPEKHRYIKLCLSDASLVITHTDIKMWMIDNQGKVYDDYRIWVDKDGVYLESWSAATAATSMLNDFVYLPWCFLNEQTRVKNMVTEINHNC